MCPHAATAIGACGTRLAVHQRLQRLRGMLQEETLLTLAVQNVVDAATQQTQQKQKDSRKRKQKDSKQKDSKKKKKEQKKKEKKKKKKKKEENTLPRADDLVSASSSFSGGAA